MSTIEYVVKEGDTLSEILYDMTGDGTYENYTQFAAANGIENPDHIVPGQVLNIPVADSTSGGSTSSSGSSQGGTHPVLNNQVSSTVANAYMNSSAGSTGGSGYSGSNSSAVAFSSSSNSGMSATSAMQGDPRYSASSTNSTSGVGGTTSSSTNSSSSSSSTVSASASGMGFSYFVEDDTITYDLDTALVKATELQEAIQNASYATDNLIVTLGNLQDQAHDKQGSVIVESFVDFEHLIGDYYEGTGIVGFINDVAALSDEMNENLLELQNRTLS